MPLCPAAVDPAPDAVGSAPVLAAARDLPPAECRWEKPGRQNFKRYPIGFFHIDIAEVQAAEGKLYLFVGIDRTSKFAVTQLVATAERKTAWAFLQYRLEAVPYQVHTILTDNAFSSLSSRATGTRSIPGRCALT